MTTPTLPEAARMALEALTNCTSEHGHRCNRCDSEVDEGGRVADALRAALAASEAPTPLTDYELTQMAQRASAAPEELRPWWMVLCREVEKRVRQENALDKLAAESQRLGLYQGKPVSGADELAAGEAQAEPVATLHDDGYWTPKQSEAGRLLNDRLMRAGSRVDVYTHPAAPQQPPVSLLWQVRKALARAAAICDAVPNRQDGHLGALVNPQPDGTHGYREIHEAEAALVAYLTTPEAAPQQPAPADPLMSREELIAAAESIGMRFPPLELPEQPAPAERGEQTAQGVALKWAEAPARTQWGAGMMEALLPLGKDHTLRLYAEREVLHLVPAALASAPRVPQWVRFPDGGVPAVGTECVVLVRYSEDKPPFLQIDKWDVQREDPLGMGGPTVEVGEGWDDNFDSDVLAWLAIPPAPQPEAGA